MKVWKKIVIAIGVICLCSIAVTGAYLWHLLNQVHYEVVKGPKTSAAEKKPNQTWDLFDRNGRIQILLLGVDAHEEGENGRTDSMILFSIDKNARKIRMVSLQRDLYLSIPGHGKNRLNAAYAFGQTSLLINTLKENLNLHTDYYVKVDFESFKQVIDGLSGVDIELSKAESRVLNRIYGRRKFQSGVNHLNGSQALDYCRIRKIDSDFSRGERQRKVLKAIINEVKTASPGQLHMILSSTLQKVTTDLSPMQVLSAAVQMPDMARYEVSEMSAPSQGNYHDATIRGMMVLVPDLEENQRLLKDFLK